MKSEKFNVVFKGQALEEAMIDVSDLAPSLLALNSLINESGKILQTSDSISLKVKSFESGSFEVELIASAGDIYNQLVNIFSTKEADAISNLLGIIGLTGASGIFGLLKLIKWLKGKNPVSIIESGPEGVEFILSEDNKKYVDNRVFRLFRNIRIREFLYNFIQPISKQGIDSVCIKYQKEVVTEVLTEELDYFIPPEPIDTIINEYTIVTALQIVTLSFKDDNKWKFFDGNNQFFASILDSEFLAKIENNIEWFAKGCILKVELLVKQSSKAENLSSEYFVVKVIEHIKPVEQLSLFSITTDSRKDINPKENDKTPTS
jgi:hypothetical protein